MLGLQIYAPLHREVELLSGFFQNIHGLGVAYTAEVVIHHVMQPLQQALVHEGVEELHLHGAALQHTVDDILHHGLGGIHIVVQVGKGHLRLYHPEFGGMALGIAHLRPEGGSEGIHVTKGHGKVLRIQLAGDGEAGDLAEKVLTVVHGAVLFPGQVIQIQGSDSEHLPGALTVGAGDDRGL